jgi:Family of unknown function (DUF6119)
MNRRPLLSPGRTQAPPAAIAAARYHRGLAPLIIVTGKINQHNGIIEAREFRRLLLEEGVRDSVTRVNDQSPAIGVIRVVTRVRRSCGSKSPRPLAHASSSCSMAAGTRSARITVAGFERRSRASAGKSPRWTCRNGTLAEDGKSDYNEHVANVRAGYVCLDRKGVPDPLGHGSTVEICDLLGPDDEFIHVKRASGSSPLSHLFAQGPGIGTEHPLLARSA